MELGCPRAGAVPPTSPLRSPRTRPRGGELQPTSCVAWRTDADTELFTAVQRWRSARRLPRLVHLIDDDNALLVDFDNVVSVESFVQLTRAHSEAELEEVFPGPDSMCAQGPEGRYAHELVVPFVAARRRPPPTSAPLVVHKASVSTFHPGSDWLYAKLYCGEVIADEVITDLLAPVKDHLITSGLADRWFFIRYSDPEPHLRVRFHGRRAALHNRALPHLEEALRPWLLDGRIWRVSLESYERELDRYGGATAIELAEQLFHADSDAAAEIVARLAPGRAGADARWRLALRGSDLILSRLGLDVTHKLAVMRSTRDTFVHEHHLEGDSWRRVSRRHRELAPGLEPLLAPTWDRGHDLAPGFQILDELGDRVSEIAEQLGDLDRHGDLTVPIAELATSFVHMHVNRLLRSSHRRQETILYEFLVRHYERLARRPQPDVERGGSG